MKKWGYLYIAQSWFKKYLLSVFSSFLNDKHSRNLVNSFISDWFLTERGVLQGFILSPFIFQVYTADLTMEDTNSNNPNVGSQISLRESNYANDVEFWRAHTDIYQSLTDIQIAIINLQNWCSKWQISIIL